MNKITKELSANANLSHYRIISKLGAGGMGEVYLAEDLRLKRRVALKVLPEAVASDADHLRRFEQEAHAASALNHPNILTIFEFGTVGETHFIASELVQGETLYDKLRSGRLSLSETLDITIQITSALKAAHEAGIIHRDIKPENVMIREDGYVKLLDFGIAKLSAPPVIALGNQAKEEAETRIQSPTQPGMIVGTVAYMSPEQARGKVVDPRTDIFSLGVVLYEMLTSRHPFTGETINHTIVAILEKEARPITQPGQGFPPELERIVKQALAKGADERYQTAKDLLGDLKTLQKRMEFESELERSPSAEQKFAAQTQRIKAESTAQTDTRNSIAVLPFTNMSPDVEDEYLCDGLAEELLNALTKIDDLKVAARTSTFSFKGKNANVSEIANALSVKTVLDGSVRKSGDRLRITVRLVNAVDGYQLWSERFDSKLQDIFDIQDEITLAVVDALKVKLFGKEKAAALKRYTDNTQAYELYVKGLYHYHKYTAEGWLKAIECFEQAIEVEPNYATAYTKLASALSFCWFFSILPANETVAKWKAANLRALEIDDSLDEAHGLFARFKFFYEWNWAEAEREFLRSIELNPDNPEVHHQYGLFLTCLERSAEAIAEAKKALALDPLSLLVNLQVGWIYLFTGHLDELSELAKKVLAIEPNFHGAHWQLGRALEAKGLHEEALESYRKAWSLGSVQVVLSGIGLTCGILGRRDEALRVLDQLLEMRKRQPVVAMNIARVYNGLGDIEKAIEWLRIAVEERNGELVFLNIETKGQLDIFGRRIRQDPRFQDILRRIGLPTVEAPLIPTDENFERQALMLKRTTTGEKGTRATTSKAESDDPREKQERRPN